MFRSSDKTKLSILRRLKAFSASREGSILFPFALVSAVLFISIGFAIDYTRLVSERERGQTALDAAVLGYVRQYINTQNKQSVSEYAQGLAKANDGSNLQWTWSFKDALVSQTQVQLSATGTARFPNTIMRIFGQDYVDLTVTSSALAYIPSVSVSIVPDISWTMRGARLTALQGALKAFSTSIYQIDPIFANKLRVHMVPYADGVNVSEFSGVADIAGNWEYQPWEAWKTWRVEYYMAVAAQEGLKKHVVTVNPSSSGPLTYKETAYIYNSGKWVLSGVKYQSQNWGGCLQLKQSEISDEAVPATRSRKPLQYTAYSGFPHCPPSSTRMRTNLEDKSAFDAAVDGLTIGWGTSHDFGLLWAKRSLSPDWASTLNTESRPWNNDKEYPKYVIMLSDGQAATAITFGDEVGRNRQVIEGNTQQLCSDMKSKGVKIMTVAFEMEASDYGLLESCASPGYFYIASSTNVADVFQSIADKIKAQNLRIGSANTLSP